MPTRARSSNSRSPTKAARLPTRTDDFQFAAAVASFGMLLRNSEYKGNPTYDAVLEIAQSALGEDPHGYRRGVSGPGPHRQTTYRRTTALSRSSLDNRRPVTSRSRLSAPKLQRIPHTSSIQANSELTIMRQNSHSFRHISYTRI